MHVMLAKGSTTGHVFAQFAGVPVRVHVNGEQHVFAHPIHEPLKVVLTTFDCSFPAGAAK